MRAKRVQGVGIHDLALKHPIDLLRDERLAIGVDDTDERLLGMLRGECSPEPPTWRRPRATPPSRRRLARELADAAARAVALQRQLDHVAGLAREAEWSLPGRALPGPAPGAGSYPRWAAATTETLAPARAVVAAAAS